MPKNYTKLHNSSTIFYTGVPVTSTLLLALIATNPYHLYVSAFLIFYASSRIIAYHYFLLNIFKSYRIIL